LVDLPAWSSSLSLERCAVVYIVRAIAFFKCQDWDAHNFHTRHAHGVDQPGISSSYTVLAVYQV
jgi:hypothetical protein